ncbi:MAG TPA: NAD(P)H-dependent oxidoreductase [Bacteroidales bacterium]|nr:NAD(P)H-dependent oxidoreductase [Bacteroidales bacterium]
MAEPVNKILLYYAHPTAHKSKLNKALIGAAENTTGVTIRNLYDLYPDYYIDIVLEQKLLLEHDIIIWQHPFYWYSAPSILKEWIDLVLEHGFAYGKGGIALQGKKVMTTITTGAREEAYSKKGRNRYTIKQLLAPFDQTVYLCNMTYLPPFVVHGSLLIEQESLDKAVATYKKAIISLRDDLFDEEEYSKIKYMNELVE